MDKHSGDAGNGYSQEWEDSAFWLTRADEEVIDWIVAIREVDQAGDERQLLNLLRSERSLPPIARLHLADLIARYGLKRKKNGRPRTPSYDHSEDVLKLKFAVDEVRHRKGITREQAIELVAQLLDIPQNTIVAGCRGSHTSLRALNKRLKERDEGYS